MKRYEELAATIAALIGSGTLSAGARVPSVRAASAQYGVSPATVFQAYYLLEDRGLIEARARSGYYVRALPATPLAEPAASRPSQRSTKVGVSELVFSVVRSMKDPDVVPLGSAFPSPLLFPWPRLTRSLASANRRQSVWSSILDLPPGNETLRRQIALRHLTNGVPAAVDDVIVTNGALEGLNLCLQAVTRPGDVVAVESPGFYVALQALERLSLRAVEIPVHPRDGLDLAALADALDRHPVRACWFMTNFQNPVGALMPDAKKRELVQLLTRHEVPLIEDDVYSELYFGGAYPRPAKTYDEHGWVMYCSSFSKTLAPGYRIGWVLPGRFGEKIERMKWMTTLTASVPAQAAIADFLTHGNFDRHLRKLRQTLANQQAQMLQAIGTHFPRDTRVTRPEGGYFLWVELPESIDALKLQQIALEHGISIAPGPLFSVQAAYKNFIRLNYGHPWSDSIEQALQTIGQIAKSMV
jgi:DNA-binding transcriptional MocR family regulator